MVVVLASKNPHKLVELQAILAQHGLEIVLESELGVDIDVDETGTTFEENSLLKAQAVMKATGLPAIADDSGLVVDALDGAPGVYSARYGSKTQSGLELVLEQMKEVPEERRTARFVCVITLARPDGSVVQARGACEGVIAAQPMGTSGFGYDPIFYVPQEGGTFAQIPARRKNEISHRANALQAFVTKLQEEKAYADQ